MLIEVRVNGATSTRQNELTGAASTSTTTALITAGEVTGQRAARRRTDLVEPRPDASEQRLQRFTARRCECRVAEPGHRVGVGQIGHLETGPPAVATSANAGSTAMSAAEDLGSGSGPQLRAGHHAVGTRKIGHLGECAQSSLVEWLVGRKPAGAHRSGSGVAHQVRRVTGAVTASLWHRTVFWRTVIDTESTFGATVRR